jgi:hypothetical protein
MTQPHHPLLVDLDKGVWSGRLDKVERWLSATRLLQTAYRRLLDSTVSGISEPHIRSYLTELRDVAREHESTVDDLVRAFGREPTLPGLPRTLGATVLGPARQAIGHLEGAASGATTGSWRNLRMVLLSNLDAICGFAVTEQLGLALGVPAVIDITFPVLRRKTQDQLLLQEYLLEMATNAALLDKDL